MIDFVVAYWNDVITVAAFLIAAFSGYYQIQHYRAEEAARRKYRARSDHSSWHDIRYRNGTPADVKAAQHSRQVRYGRFCLWR